jgi:AmpD protein
MVQYPVTYIAGHEHIAPGRKEDPGPGFDWRRLQDSAALADAVMPASGPNLGQASPG